VPRVALLRETTNLFSPERKPLLECNIVPPGSSLAEGEILAQSLTAWQETWRKYEKNVPVFAKQLRPAPLVVPNPANHPGLPGLISYAHHLILP
jgi:hypothetical protein